jgi:hypothetical protein
MSADNYLELLLAQAEGTDSHRALFAHIHESFILSGR